MTAKESAPRLEKLREPFPANQISKLPKETRAQIDERKSNANAAIKCNVCGGWHHKRAVHLDYVGHAALTDRLLDVDITWSWEPVSFTADGLPAFDRNGGLWIRLTVCGVTRLGYGSADGKNGGDAVKEIIGDALRNAAMRFGAALDLWHKGDLHGEDEPAVEERAAPVQEAATKNPPARKPAKSEVADDVLDTTSIFRDLMRTMEECETPTALNKWFENNGVMIEELSQEHRDVLREAYRDHEAAIKQTATLAA